MDVGLTNGEGFMTEDTNYQKHLKASVQSKDVSSLECIGGFISFHL